VDGNSLAAIFYSLLAPGMAIPGTTVIVLLAVVLTARANNAMTHEIITPAQALRMAGDGRIMIIDILWLYE